MDKSFRLFDFNINILKSASSSSGSEEEPEYKSRIDSQAFLIQMFGINFASVNQKSEISAKTIETVSKARI